ncbi:hypothetical protein [Caedibacter taeniospiralis]|uniref:Uncharacterized protein n=1 Tax=Caedibacter taeniospiralis TaxID=28907 RepID=Q6TFF8_CAETA|nr:hypothetical protein [Caedibacter taeniospiralis]AAR87101.1 hypothetical protein [Caedibacter taeniospiralis]
MDDLNTNLICGITDKNYKITLHTNLSNHRLNAEKKMESFDDENYKKLIEIGKKAVYEISEIEALPSFLNMYYKGKATLLFEIDISKSSTFTHPDNHARVVPR